MKIAFYMPLKPMGHSNPSGDLVTGTELFTYLSQKKHAIEIASPLRCRLIYYKPWALMRLLIEQAKIAISAKQANIDLWLSYHSYYKAPDLLGPTCSKRLQIPYVIFQGIYSSKRRKKLKTLPGYILNKRALLEADHILTNKLRDHENLIRIIPENRLTYIAPGVTPDDFNFSRSARSSVRDKWYLADKTVIMSAAMMRPGVKTESIRAVIHSCAELHRRGKPIQLIIVGDGSNRKILEREAMDLLGNHVRFVGKVVREKLYRYYSAADIFAFPGIEESLGMVYLEAQSCNLPVVAYKDWGASEAVIDGKTGLLSPACTPSVFTDNLQRLIQDISLRKRLGVEGGRHIREKHDLSINYNKVERILHSVVASHKSTIPGRREKSH